MPIPLSFITALAKHCILSPVTRTVLSPSAKSKLDMIYTFDCEPSWQRCILIYDLWMTRDLLTCQIICLSNYGSNRRIQQCIIYLVALSHSILHTSYGQFKCVHRYVDSLPLQSLKDQRTSHIGAPYLRSTQTGNVACTGRYIHSIIIVATLFPRVNCWKKTPKIKLKT